MITIEAGPFIDTLRENLKVTLAEHDLAASIQGIVLSTFDRAALRAVVAAHKPPEPELTPQQRGGRTRKANRLARENAQAREALENGKGKDAHNDGDPLVRFPGSVGGVA